MKVEIYRSGLLRQWRWRIKANNNEIIGASTESFKRKEGAENNLKLNHQALREHFSADPVPFNEKNK